VVAVNLSQDLICDGLQEDDMKRQVLRTCPCLNVVIDLANDPEDEMNSSLKIRSWPGIRSGSA
jgi:hypothetical protein